MAEYTVRVELFRATDEDYARLNASMERAGFTRFVTGSSGARYQLPTGEYTLTAPGGSAAFIQTNTRDLAIAIRPNPCIFVTEATARAWSLPKVQPPPEPSPS